MSNFLIHIPSQSSGNIVKFNESGLTYVNKSAIITAGILGGVILGDYVYIGYNGITKYDVSGLTQVATSTSGDTGRGLATDGEYIYSVTNDGFLIKYEASGLTYINGVYIGTTNVTHAIIIDGDYVYVSEYTNGKLKRYNKSDLSFVDETTGVGYCAVIETDNNYVYTWEHYSIKKWNKSDLSYVTGVSTTMSTSGNAFIVNGDYVYVGGAYPSNTSNASVERYNKSDLSFVDKTTVGNWSKQTTSLVIANNYLYAATTSAYPYYIRKYNLSTMAYVTGTTYTLTEWTNVLLFSGVEITDPQAPTNLTATTVGYESITIQWDNNSELGVNVVQTYVGGNWITVDTLALSASGYTLSNLDWYTEYTIRVAVLYDGTYYPSNTIVEKTLSLPPPLCTEDWTDRFTTVDGTCGVFNGQIVFINPEYLRFYDVVIRRQDGQYYYFDTDPNSATFGQSQYLYAMWYAIQATPKAAYQDYYGSDECRIFWIPIHATNTTLTLDDISIRDVVCGGFGAVKGRIVYFMNDTSTSTYEFHVFKALKDPINSEEIVNETGLSLSEIQQFVVAPLDPATYYATLFSEGTGCSLLIGGDTIAAKPLRAVAGVKRVFITEWNNQIEYNYWSESDSDYYVSGVDSDFFNSIKIKEFIDSTLPSAWFEIKLDTKGITYHQTMNKTHQGFIFTDSMDIVIPHADNAKWKQLTEFLVNRYIIVFQDNNSQWWTMGYRLGAKADSYKRANNEYILTLNAISDNKILTNIDETYVKDNIINS